MNSEINQQVQVCNSTLSVVSPQYAGTWMDDYRSSLAAWWCSSMSLYLHGPIKKIDNDSGKLTTKTTHCHHHPLWASDDYNQHSYTRSEKGYFYSKIQLYGHPLNTDTSIIIMDSLLSPWGKKALTLFLNSTSLIWTTINLDTFYGHLSFCINGLWLYHYYEKISSRPFCPSLSHLSAAHQPCACDCTECAEEMTCHISQHTQPTRNINMLVSNLYIYKNQVTKILHFHKWYYQV